MKAKYPQQYRQAKKDLTLLLTVVLKTAGLRKLAGIRLKSSGQVSLGLEVTFLSKVQMKKLNFKYRKKNRPTDVLSFPSPEVFKRAGHLGEVLICVDVMKAQAKELGHPWTHELQVLLAHGILHLLGLDHEKSPKDAKLMARWEKKLLGQAGLIDRA